MPLFRRSKKLADPLDMALRAAAAREDDAPPRPNWGVYSDYVPQSARPPELQRLATFNLDDENADGPDEDIEFLSALARQVDAPATPRPARRAPRVTPPPAPNVYEPRETAAPDAMAAFHDYAAHRNETATVTSVLRVSDVDLGDLVEDLSDTIAALRRRRAA